LIIAYLFVTFNYILLNKF